MSDIKPRALERTAEDETDTATKRRGVARIAMHTWYEQVQGNVAALSTPDLERLLNATGISEETKSAARQELAKRTEPRDDDTVDIDL